MIPHDEQATGDRTLVIRLSVGVVVLLWLGLILGVILWLH
jgi:hypothetical protein